MAGHKLPAKQEAIAARRTHYVGKPCPHGHDGRRYTETGKCVACLMAYNKAHQRSRRTGGILGRPRHD